jgi:cystathionine beta-synthase
MLLDNILEAVGNTPLVRLNRIAQGLKPLLAAKVEFVNPGGSVKDRIGLEMVQAAERDGLLKPGGTIIEGTSGNTGMGLAMVAAVRGYRCIFTMPDKMSQEKIDTLRALGAEVVVTPTAVAHDDPRSYHSVAVRLSKEIPNSVFPNQYTSPSNPLAHYRTSGPEIWNDTDGKVTHVVIGVGTGGTISGVGRYFRQHAPHVKIIGVDPEGSIFYDWFKRGVQPKSTPYKVEGVGQDLLPMNVDFSVIDDMYQVGDKESFNVTRRLARQEGIFAGGSSGMAVAAALRLAEGLTERDYVVVILPDSGSRYLSKIFNDDWMRENQFLESPVRLTTGDVLMNKSREHQGLISVSTDCTIGEAIEVMRRHGISQLPVIEDRAIVGSLDETRLLNVLLSDTEAWNHNARQFMDAPFPVVAEDAPVESLATILQDKVQALIIQRRNGDRDIVTKSDLIFTLLKAEREIAAR